MCFLIEVYLMPLKTKGKLQGDEGGQIFIVYQYFELCRLFTLSTVTKLPATL